MKSSIIFLALALIACADAQFYNKCGYRFKVITKTAGNARGLTGAVNIFRRALGDPDNLSNNVRTGGPFFKGRREINWDAAAVPFDMPFNFFDKTVTRGAVFQAKRREFRVSNPSPPPPVDDTFSSLLPRRLSNRFRTFSPERLFTPFEDNKVTQIFKVPGTNKRANTAGFGAVFTDVELRKKTYIDLFTKSGCRLWRIEIPPRARGLSFGGLYIVGRKPVIWKVVIKLGTISVKQAGGGGGGYSSGSGDVVVLDDLLYGEPIA